MNQHTLYALDANSGELLWQFTAGGRIDSSPTIHNGSVLFGCADGWVYCLRAETVHWPGDIWSPRATGNSSPSSSSSRFGRCTAACWYTTIGLLPGRPQHVLRRRPAARAARRDERPDLAVKKLDENDPETGQNLQTLIEAKYMPVANADLFSCNGKNIFMQTQKFDLDGNRIDIAPIQPGTKRQTWPATSTCSARPGFSIRRGSTARTGSWQQLRRRLGRLCPATQFESSRSHHGL